MLQFSPVLAPSSPTLGIPRRSSLGRMVHQSTVLLMSAIGVLILVLAFLILFYHNANATRGYRLRTLERERSQLLLEEEILKMNIAREQSLTVLEEDQKITVMVQPREIAYTGREAAFATAERVGE